MRKRYSITAVIMCVVFTICACSPKEDVDREEKKVAADVPEKPRKDREEKPYQSKLNMIEPSAYDNVMGLNLEKGTSLSIIGKAEGVPYWDAVREGAEQAVRDINENLGYEGRNRVKITYSAPALPDDVDEQVNILDEELARYPEALAIAIADTKACEVQFDLAAESDIPVVAFDSGSDYQGLMATVSTDNRAAAQEAAVRIAELMDDAGEVLLFVHDSKSESALARESAFVEEIESNHPDMSVAEIYHMDQLADMQETIAGEINAGTYSKEDNAESVPEQPAEEGEGVEVTADMISQEDVIDYILKNHPDVAGCYATNGDAVRLALETIERHEMRSFLIGYDADEDELEALGEGRIDALIMQNPFGMGYAAVIASARAALSMGNEAVVDTGYTWITQENLADENIQKLLY